MGAIPLSAYNHSEAEDLLMNRIGGELLANHVMITRPWQPRSNHIPCSVHAIAAKEFPIFNGNLNGQNGSHRIDVLFFCAAGTSTTYRNENFSVGVEVKASVEDLFRDRKIPTYFDRTDYFYLVVPERMLGLGLMKATQWDHVGVASLDSGRIYKPAFRQFPAEHERTMILERLLLEKSHLVLTAPINPTANGLTVWGQLPNLDWSRGYPVYVRN